MYILVSLLICPDRQMPLRIKYFAFSSILVGYLMPLRAFPDLAKKAITVAPFLFEKLHFNHCLYRLFGKIKRH